MKLFVAIVHGQWVGLCEKYKDKLRGQFLAGIVKRYSTESFGNTKNPQRKLFLQDDDPNDNLKRPKRAMSDVGDRLLQIPQRSNYQCLR